MAWNDLASNQMVSFTDAQGGGFTLNSGQSSVTSNQCMTKNDALTKYALDSSYMSSYSSNQLVPKSTWVGVGQGSLSLSFEKGGSCGIIRLYINNVLITSLTTTTTYNTTLNTGDTFYVEAILAGAGCVGFNSQMQINSTTRGILYSSFTAGNQTSPTFTRQSGENISINARTYL